MCKGDANKGMLIVSAPKGTHLEVSEEDKGGCVLKMDANGKGNLKIYSCQLNEGVKEFQVKGKGTS